MSLLVPKTFASVRGAALDVTGPVASALHEVTATAQGLVTGADDYWDAARQNRELKRQPARNASANGRSQSDLRGKSAAQGRVAITRTCPRLSRSRSDCRFLIQQSAPISRSCRSERRMESATACRSDLPTASSGESSDVGALASRVLLVSDRANIVPARLLRNGIPVIAQGRGDGTSTFVRSRLGAIPSNLGISSSVRGPAAFIRRSFLWPGS